ncbi:GntR family transcriptional regulator [Ruegeria hyattellae]|uniref:GntR family transcriptional regulator n=1 Tax=Ruegeria hyattellae TaxID=3233337 RepID=UPI00355C2ED3
MTNEALLYSQEIDHTLPITPQVYNYLRVRIVDNRLPPGAKISEASLAHTLNISRTPLRAALQKLASEGLVNTRPHVGSTVAELDVTQLQEAVFLRAALETAVVRRLADMNADLSSLDPIMEIQQSAAKRDDYAAFFVQDEAFHAELARLAGVPRAWKLALSIKGHVDRQRYLLMAGIAMRSQRAYEEHTEIIDEIRSGDADGAARAMHGHVNSVLELDEYGEMKKLPDSSGPDEERQNQPKGGSL